MLRICSLSLILVLLIAAQSFAVPSITSTSGTYTDGSTITINTTGAGAKDPAPPFFYDSFESGTVGNLVAGNTGQIGSAVWDDYEYYGNNVYYSSTYATNGSKSAKKSAAGSLADIGIAGLNSDTAYISLRWRWSASSTDWQSAIMKMTRINANGAFYTTDPAARHLGQPRTTSNWAYFSYNDGTNPSTSVTVPWPAQNTWHRQEIYYKLSDPAGTSNGSFQTWQNETLGVNRTSILTRSSEAAAKTMDSFLLPFGVTSNSSNTYTFYADDVYFDNTLARVELCNAAGTTCFPQLPLTWASDGTLITATLNLGTFESGDTAYVHVFDSTGAESDGYQITIGESGTDTTPPVITLLAPFGTLAYGTTTTELSHITDEAATCRYSTTPGTAYASMTSTFDTSLGSSHSVTITGLTNDTIYAYYVRCIDAFGNANITDTTYSFSVAAASGSAGVLSWQYGTYEAVRADIRIPINIVRTGGSTGSVTVQWSSNSQTAVHNVDYYGNDNVTVTFADGVTTMPINTYGTGDDGIEMIQNGALDDRYFQMALTNPTGGATLGDPSLATVTILGESLPPTPPWKKGIFKVGTSFYRTAP